jgi:hypothetical protein
MDVTGTKHADIEDLFSETFYFDLVHRPGQAPSMRLSSTKARGSSSASGITPGRSPITHRLVTSPITPMNLEVRLTTTPSIDSNGYSSS